MIKRLALVATMALATTGLCAAAQNPCPPIVLNVATPYGGMQMVQQLCGLAVLGQRATCACPNGTIIQQSSGTYTCDREVLSQYAAIRFIGRHLVNGHCVPDESLAMRRRTEESTSRPKIVAPAPAMPVIAPRAPAQPAPAPHVIAQPAPPAPQMSRPAPAPMPMVHTAPAMAMPSHPSGGVPTRPRT